MGLLSREDMLHLLFFFLLLTISKSVDAKRDESSDKLILSLKRLIMRGPNLVISPKTPSRYFKLTLDHKHLVSSEPN